MLFFKIKKIVKKIKQRLIKKVILEEFYYKDDRLIYKFKLKNFLWITKVESQLINNSTTRKLPIILENGYITVSVPIGYISNVDINATVNIYINNEKMWITSGEQFKMNDSKNFILNENYFVTNVNKTIYIKKLFKDEFRFINEKIFIENVYTKYDSIKIELNFAKFPLNSNFNIYALNNNKIKILSKFTNHERNYLSIILKDLHLLALGNWQLFINVQDKLYPLCISHENELNSHIHFHTCNHRVYVINKNSNLYLSCKPHVLPAKLLNISTVKDNYIKLKLSIEKIIDNRHYYFVVNDVRTNTDLAYPLIKSQNEWIAEIPLNELAKNNSTKRFFIQTNTDEPIKYQLNLNEHRKGFKRKTKVIADSQIVTLLFYKRKDKSLGLKITKPKIIKEITEIQNFKIKGYAHALEKFINCKPYLCIEDRNSLDAIFVPIERNFVVDLLEHDLISLKSKDKTILDIFLVIKDEQNNIIRKEKIKYKYADYKKDNYYDYVKLNDDVSNQHHFLITTTPFNNLKIESFTIPHDIQIPNNPSKKDENIWLIGERYNTAQDNGFVLFNWLQNHTEIDIYYVIDKDSDDYERIKNNPNVIEFGSKKHFEIAFKAKVLLCTHDFENILPYKPAKGFFGYEETYKVFLQHGVLGRKNVEYHKKYYELPFDLFIVSSEPEKYNVVVEQLGYDESEVAVTGLARFDNLIQENTPKDILLMPTWRDWINTDHQFLESEYYTRYKNLISNERLHSLLEQYNVNLNFYPHYRAQDYFKKVIEELPERIKFIELGSISVQKLLINHALLITDYSSVSFDFTLMKKPVIYYHFDVKRFFRKGILRPIDETFLGRIAYTEDELIDLIEERLIRDFENYNIDITGIIKYQDQENCKRIYQIINSRLNKSSKVNIHLTTSGTV